MKTAKEFYEKHEGLKHATKYEDEIFVLLKYVFELMEDYARGTIKEMLPSKKEIKIVLQSMLNERYPIPTIERAEELHPIRMDFGLGFEVAIDWIKSQLTDKLQDDVKLDYSREDGK